MENLRYSRQIVTYGAEMHQKLTQTKYLVYGMRGLGAEVAKHLILGGVKQVHVCDETSVEIRDLAANPFIEQESITQNVYNNL